MGRGGRSHRGVLPIVINASAPLMHAAADPAESEVIGADSTAATVPGTPCRDCGRGTYEEKDQTDDLFGVLHCTACGDRVDWGN